MKNKIVVMILFVSTLVCTFSWAQVSCIPNLNLSLSESGTGSLSPAVISFGALNPAYTYTLNRSFFSCADVGNTYNVVLSQYSGSTLIANCNTNVIIEWKFSTPCTERILSRCNRDVNIALNSSGIANVRPVDVVPTSIYRSEYTYTISPSTFDCSQLGAQNITITTTSPSGRSGSITCSVNIIDRRIFAPPCYNLRFRDFRFFPRNLLLKPVSPGTVVGFETSIEIKDYFKQSISGVLKVVLSKDNIIDAKDIDLVSSSIYFKEGIKKQFVSNKFELPSKLENGKYFILVDIESDNKSQSIGAEMIEIPIQIENSQLKGRK